MPMRMVEVGRVSSARRYTEFAYDSPETLDSKLREWTSHETLREWVKENASVFGPARVHLVDGSEEEYDMLTKEMEHSGMLIRLNPDKRPNSFLARSGPSDVARVEGATFICSESESDAGPTNNWRAPSEMRATLAQLYKDSMAGRTLYVIPFCMGPLGSHISKVGVQLTDSPYVVASTRIMTRMGKGALDSLGDDGAFVKALHSVGHPLPDKASEESTWPSNSTKYITHFPETREIMSYGSGYGGNALLGKKCFALRIASSIARQEGTLAEHMLIVKLTNPEGRVRYVAGAFPSACGKTNLAMLDPKLPGWKVETVGDDIAWMRFDDEGRLRAINPEAGFFGVAPGTSDDTNGAAMQSMHANSIFTNVAMTDDGDVWWEGMTDEPPSSATDWLRRKWTPGCGRKAAHPNSRFTAPASQCPTIAADWEDPAGVPISAILFGGRRRDTVPLVYQSLDWEHGTWVGASMMSETTSAAEGQVGELAADPMAMRPFIGYHVADYIQHWYDVGAAAKDKVLLPKIFMVNWFRRGPDNKFIWPGFGENSRILKWVFERCDAMEDAKATAADQVLDKGPPSKETPIGIVPDVASGGLDLSNMKHPVDPKALEEITSVDQELWRKEVERYRAYHDSWGHKVPQKLLQQHDRIRSRLA